MSGHNGSVPIVGQIAIRMLANGNVELQCQCADRIQAMGLLEVAKLDIEAQFRAKAQEKVHLPPVGLQVPRA